MSYADFCLKLSCLFCSGSCPQAYPEVQKVLSRANKIQVTLEHKLCSPGLQFALDVPQEATWSCLLTITLQSKYADAVGQGVSSNGIGNVEDSFCCKDVDLVWYAGHTSQNTLICCNRLMLLTCSSPFDNPPWHL